MTPSAIFDLLAVVLLAVAAVSAARLAVTRPGRGGADVGVDGTHLLTAIAMAGMLTPALRTIPDGGWEVIFALLIAWFAFRVARDARVNGLRALAGGHCAPHLLHSGSMLYMYAATTSIGGMAGMSMAGMNQLPGSSGSTMITLDYPTLAFVFTVILIGYSVWDLDQLAGQRSGRTRTRVPLAGIGPLRIPAMAGADSVSPVPSGRPAVDPDPGSGTGHDQGAAGAGASAGARSGTGVRSARDRLLSPAVTAGTRLTLGLTMVFLLIIAI